MIIAIIILSILLAGSIAFIFWLLGILKNTFEIIDSSLDMAAGKTPKKFRTAHDGKYYPATVISQVKFDCDSEMVVTDFSMYEDSDIRYSDICRDNANGANGWPTTFTAKYIYDASVLDFIEIYTNSSFAEVKVLEHGSTGETGPDHDKCFTVEVHLNSNVIGEGSGHSKKNAEQAAAKKALELMGIEL